MMCQKQQSLLRSHDVDQTPKRKRKDDAQPLASFSFGSESLDLVWIRFQPWAVDQIDTIRDGGHHGVETFANRFGLAGQVDDQA